MLANPTTSSSSALQARPIILSLSCPSVRQLPPSPDSLWPGSRSYQSAIRARKECSAMAHRPYASEEVANKDRNGHQAEYRSVSGQVELFTTEQRRAKGRTQRVAVPRKAHETFQTSAYRPDPVETLIQQGDGRLQHLLPIRYGRMLASPFAFFRGSAAVMAWDLSHTSSTKLTAQLC